MTISTLDRRPRSKPRSSTSGFTLLELLVIVVIVGTLAAIMAPGWSAFMNNQRLNVARDEVYQAISEAQSQARRSRILSQASFRQNGGIVQWAIHPATTAPEAAIWNSLNSTIQIDGETTLAEVNNIYRVQFNHQGRLNGQLGRITLSIKNGGRAKRCVIVSTLLGAIRKGQEHADKIDGKYCY